MFDRGYLLPVTRQAKPLSLGRSSIYAVPRPLPSARFGTMHRIDAQHLEHPLTGSCIVRDMRRLQSVTTCRLPRGFVYLATVMS